MKEVVLTKRSNVANLIEKGLQKIMIMVCPLFQVL